jgi:cytochrome c
MLTRTPIYGHVAPVSWLMERDILEGRKAMNLSLWDSYSTDQQGVFAAKIAQETKAHAMPLLQYRMIHWSSSISGADMLVPGNAMSFRVVKQQERVDLISFLKQSSGK